MTRFAGDIFSSYEDPRRPNFSQSAASGMYKILLEDFIGYLMLHRLQAT